MTSGFIVLLTQHLKHGKFKNDPFNWLFTTTKDNLAINVYHTKDREVLGAVITAKPNSKIVSITKGGMDQQLLNLLKEHIQSWALHAEIEIE